MQTFVSQTRQKHSQKTANTANLYCLKQSQKFLIQYNQLTHDSLNDINVADYQIHNSYFDSIILLYHQMFAVMSLLLSILPFAHLYIQSILKYCLSTHWYDISMVFLLLYKRDQRINATKTRSTAWSTCRMNWLQELKNKPTIIMISLKLLLDRRRN